MWATRSDGKSEGLLPFRSLGAAILLVLCPLVVLFIVRWGAPKDHPNGIVYAGHGGDASAAVGALLSDPVGEVMAFVLPAENATGARTWAANEGHYVEAATYIVLFVAFEVFLLVSVPGPRTYGPRAASGHIPEYTKNGLTCYVLSLLAFELLASNGVVDGAVIMRLYPFFIALLNACALLLCAALVLKGLYAPSTPDNSSSGNFMMDMFWGTELYPRVLGVDVKVMTNCRFGMVAWALCLVSFAHFNADLNGGRLHYDMAAACFLVVFYLGKFFLWEHHYFRTMDIAHDRAGFYLCWGCLVWVQVIYVVFGYYYAAQEKDSIVQLFGEDNARVAFFVLVAVGMAMVFLNYEADRQRMHARDSRGRGRAWGHRYGVITAEYHTEDGARHESLLLASHLWGPARHFHYVFEIGAAVCWSVPVSLTHIFPNIYWIFLTILLLDRAMRDDSRCAQKYGKHWDRYRKNTPYLVLPGVY